jgi:hypothetical protein
VARRSLWAEFQRERANRLRREQQARREAERRAVKEARAREQATRAAIQRAAADQRERDRLYIEDRKAQAEAMADDLQIRIAELDSVLTAALHQGPGVSLASLVEMPPFDPGGLDRPVAEPRWEQFAPRPPGWVGRMFGGGARYAGEQAAAREVYEQECARHAAAESDRRRELAERRRAYDREAAEVAQFERKVRAADPEAVSQFFTRVLATSAYPEDFADRPPRALYRPEPRVVVIDYELPPQSVIPIEQGFKYVRRRVRDPRCRPPGQRDQGTVCAVDRDGRVADDPRGIRDRPGRIRGRPGRAAAWSDERDGRGLRRRRLESACPEILVGSRRLRVCTKPRWASCSANDRQRRRTSVTMAVQGKPLSGH